MEANNVKLIKAKVIITTEFVVENVYADTDLNKVAAETFNSNRNDIISQAMEAGEYTISAQEISNISDLPSEWNGECYPWTVVVYGDKNPSKKIKEFLK